MKNILKDLLDFYKIQPIPDCLCQFGFNWKSKAFRSSIYFPFAAHCKGMTNKEYGDF